MTSDDWTDAERRDLDSLPREASPPPELEERVVEALRRERLLRGGSGGGWRAWRLAAAAAVLAGAAFLAGIGYGRSSGKAADARATRAASPSFAFVLLDEPVWPGDEAAHVAEYRNWAAGLRHVRFVTGTKLGEAGELVTARGTAEPGPPERAVRGWFVVEAPDLASALAIARTCPHLKYGGRVLVRTIVPT
jgi:hypothetical protein